MTTYSEEVGPTFRRHLLHPSYRSTLKVNLEFTVYECSLTMWNVTVSQKRKFYKESTICLYNCLSSVLVQNTPLCCLKWKHVNNFVQYNRCYYQKKKRLEQLHKCCVLSFRWFPVVWILYADVSELFACEDGTYSVPKRRQIKFTRPRITERKE